MIDFTRGADEAPDLDKLETALTLARTSREFNRKRAEVLDDRLHRIRAILDEDQAEDERRSNYPSELDWAAVRAERDALRDKVVRREKQIEKLEQKVRGYDNDRHSERDRADQLSSRVKVMEREAREADAELRRRASAFKVLENRYETLLATLDNAEEAGAQQAADYRQSLAARDHLLAAEATRVRNAREILAARRVAEAADQIVTSKGAILADAVRNALAALNA